MLDLSKVILKNGISAYSIVLPNTHSVVLSLYVKAGIKYEDCQHTGVSHLIEHLLFRNLHDINQKQIYYEMESMGTTLMATTYPDFIRFYIEVLPQYVDRAFDLIYKLLLNNHWSNEEIRLEKQVVINQIEERQFTFNDQSNLDYWKGTCMSNLVMGTKSKVKRLSANTILNYYNRFFQPQNSCLVVSGNISHNQIEAMHEKLKLLENKNESPLSSEPIYPKNFCCRNNHDDIVYSITGDYADVKICFEVNYSHLQPEVAEYIHTILGDGLGCRLSMVLREELGLVDEIFTEFRRHNGFGVLTINYDVLCNRLIESFDKVFQIITGLKEDITEHDVDISLPFLTDNWELFYDSPSALNYHYGWRSFILGESFATLEEISERFRRISINQLKDTALKLFVGDNMLSFIFNDSELEKPTLVEKCLKKWRNIL